MLLIFPYYMKFDYEQGAIINEAVKDWHDETIRPLITMLYDEFKGEVLDDDLIKIALEKVQEIDRVIIGNGGRSIKDQLRGKLGLLPDVSNIKQGKHEN